MENIGFIGLGIMGKPMALNLIHAGYPVSVYARRAEIAKAFTPLGDTPYASAKELAPHVDIIITMLSSTVDMEEVMLGKNGLIHSVKPGSVVIDMGTTSTPTTQRFVTQLAQKNVEMLDAPVTGTEQDAIDGTLSILVGGKPGVLERVHPILSILGKQIIHIGTNGCGQIAKACHQILVAETIAAVSEAFTLAKASGTDPSKVHEALLSCGANHHILEVHGKRMLESDYKLGFKSALHRKDMHLALEQAHQVGINLPMASHAMHSLDRVVSKGHGDLDSSAMHMLVDE